jgi:choline dehydrogenase-like flavoprotein
MADFFDILIVGGGPAGSTAGTLLAKQGWNVAIFEKETFPRFKIGESLLPGSLRTFERMGVKEKIDQADFVRLAFLLDLGLYYLGIVSQPFKRGIKGLEKPPFTEPLSSPVFALMRTYNRRFVEIARRRRHLGLLGKTNMGKRCLANGFTLSRADIRLIFKTLFRWCCLEATEGWRSWWQRTNPSPRSNSVQELNHPAG